MSGDNFSFTIEAGLECLPHAIALAYTEVSNPNSEYGVNGWYEVDSETGGRFLVLTRTKFSSAPPTVNALPHPISEDQAVALIKGWLEQQDYGPEPDQDGSNGKGFKAWLDYWGNIGNDHASIIAVAPSWSMYGK